MMDSLLRPFLFGLLLLIALLMSMAFLLGERPFAIPVVLLICGLWAVILQRTDRRPPNWPPLLLAILAALANVPLPGFTAQVPLVWRYLAVVALLLLWDLSRFRHRLQNRADDRSVRPLFGAHFLRLGWLVLLALAAWGGQQWLPLSFNFDLALLSGLLLIFGLNAVVRRLLAEQV